MNEIEKMAKVIDSVLGSAPTFVLQSRGTGEYKSVTNSEIATALVNAGYGDIKQALEDYATKLHNNIVVYLKRDFDTREEVCKIIDETLKEVCGE